MADDICYAHLLQGGLKPLTYSDYIFIDFDNRRNTACGKKSWKYWGKYNVQFAHCHWAVCWNRCSTMDWQRL